MGSFFKYTSSLGSSPRPLITARLVEQVHRERGGLHEHTRPKEGSSRLALGDGGVIRLPRDATQQREDRGQLLSYCLVEGDRKPLPALQLELAQEVLTAKPLRVPTEELGEKSAALRAYGAEGVQTHWGEIQALVVANGKVLPVFSCSAPSSRLLHGSH